MLRDVVSPCAGATRRSSWRERRREVDHPEADSRVAEAGWRRGLGQRQRASINDRAEMMKVRDDLGMVFQEGALFDSLTVAKMSATSCTRRATCRSTRCGRRVEEVLGFVGLDEHIDKMPSELSGGQRRRVAIARAMTFKPRHPALRRADDRPRSDHGDTIDDEIVKLRDIEESAHRRHPPVARRLLRGRRTKAMRDGDARCRSCRRAEKSEEAEFIMLEDGLIHFEGTRRSCGSTDPYLSVPS